MERKRRYWSQKKDMLKHQKARGHQTDGAAKTNTFCAMIAYSIADGIGNERPGVDKVGGGRR